MQKQDAQALREINRNLASSSAARPEPEVLFEAAYKHVGLQTCKTCSSDSHQDAEPRDDDEEVVTHYGTIASGNQVIKHADVRDDLSAKPGGVLCFEMEAAGLMSSFSCPMVRAGCATTFANSHENQRWQVYATGMAAAYAKDVLSVIPSSIMETEEKIVDALSGQSTDVQDLPSK